VIPILDTVRPETYPIVNDRLSGGEGDDLLGVDPGDDRLYGDGGNDEFLGGEGDDSLFAGTKWGKKGGHGHGHLCHSIMASCGQWVKDFLLDLGEEYRSHGANGGIIITLFDHDDKEGSDSSHGGNRKGGWKKK